MNADKERIEARLRYIRQQLNTILSAKERALLVIEADELANLLKERSEPLDSQPSVLDQPTVDERRLMRLLRLNSVDELNRVLSEPPELRSDKEKEAVRRSGPPDYSSFSEDELRPSHSTQRRLNKCSPPMGMSDWNASLTLEQYKTEVLNRLPSAVCKRREIRRWTPEQTAKFQKFVKLSRTNIEQGYLDFSSATAEEQQEFKELGRKRNQEPPDETWYFIVLKEMAESVDTMTIFEAQSASLGYSQMGEDAAWEAAWGKLKIQEKQSRAHRTLLILMGALFLGWVAYELLAR